jgi:hypothetical protein
MKKKLYALLLIPILFNSCTVVKFSTQSGSIIYEPAMKQQYEVVGHFDDASTGVEVLWIIDLSKPSEKIDNAINEQIKKYNGDAAINLEFICRRSLIDKAISLITSDIIETHTIKVSGDVIKYK